MSFLRRLGFYLGGLSIGLIILAFFLNGKNASCSYGPNARVLKNLRAKDRYYGLMMQEHIRSKVIDTADITKLLTKGKVDFSRSNTKLDSCKVYIIVGYVDKTKVNISAENCEKHVLIHNIVAEPKKK